MATTPLAEHLIETLAQNGYPARIVPVHHQTELLEEIESRYRDGSIAPRLYEAYLARLDRDAESRLAGTKSMIVVTAFQPALDVIFEYRGRRHEVRVPPTYAAGTNPPIEKIIDEVLSPWGYRALKCLVPRKLLAAKCGLARYGRNNIAYVPEYGSFHRLTGYYSDMPPAAAYDWRGPEALDRCADCQACIKACPTGAIDPETFQLRSDRCLTFLNEMPDAMPDWVDPGWHHCLVGCMRCQVVCPENRPFLKRTAPVDTFTEKETELVMSGRSWEDLPAGLADRLERLGLDAEWKVVPRNLRLLLH